VAIPETGRDHRGGVIQDDRGLTMAEFLTELDARLKHGSDTVWVLRPSSPLIYESDILGRIEVPEGFETDLASVPRVPIIYAMWGSRAHREAVLHDYLFRIDSRPLATFSQANGVFLEAMEIRGKSWYVRYPMWWGVWIGSYGCFHQRLVGDSL